MTCVVCGQPVIIGRTVGPIFEWPLWAVTCSEKACVDRFRNAVLGFVADLRGQCAAERAQRLQLEALKHRG